MESLNAKAFAPLRETIQSFMEKTINETLERLLNDLQINVADSGDKLERIAAADQKYIKDIKINTSNALNYANLSKKEIYLLALAIAVNEKNKTLQTAFETLGRREGVSEHEFAEVLSCVSLMNINNVFYRFRHFAGKDYYNTTPAGIKMTIMANPVLGKEFFELLSLAISAVNGCEMCVTSHEQSVLQHGSSEARVYDAVRLAATIKGFCVLI